MVSRSILFRMRNISDKLCRGSQTFVFTQPIFRKLCRLWNNMGKYFGDGWQYGACALHAGKLRPHWLTICNTYCFLIATKIARMCLNLTLCVTFPSCEYWTISVQIYLHIQYLIRTFTQNFYLLIISPTCFGLSS